MHGTNINIIDIYIIVRRSCWTGEYIFVHGNAEQINIYLFMDHVEQMIITVISFVTKIAYM